MPKGIFITGTDTGVGKTWFTVALMEALKAQGHRVVGMKPIASGATLVEGQLINEDAQLIMEHSSVPVSYGLINPVVFEPPVAPHIAAQQKKQLISLDHIIDSYNQLSSSADLVVVEGVGGWRVPISNDAYLVDIVRSLNLPVIMVVGIRLGCINHAILTAESIRADGINLCGWASSQLEKEVSSLEIIETLTERLACPHIANLPYLEGFEPENILEKIDTSIIFKA